MRFYIFRTSMGSLSWHRPDWRSFDREPMPPPCEGCVLTPNYDPDRYDDMAYWSIDLESLDDLVALAQSLKRSLIIHPVLPESERCTDRHMDSVAIEIYEGELE
jgi:hypothetical protein